MNRRILPNPRTFRCALGGAALAVFAFGLPVAEANPPHPPRPPRPGRVAARVRVPVPQHVVHPRRAKVTVRIAPPAPKVVVVPPAPQPGHVWVEGYWRWDENDNDFLWEGGVWVAPPGGMNTWVPGHWRQGKKGWVWVDGHWK